MRTGKLSFLIAAACLAPAFSFAEWSVSFDEKTSVLSAENDGVSVSGELLFESDGKKWGVVNSRDGVKNRFALVDAKGNVQGYLVFPRNNDTLEMLFYHRTAQAYSGKMKLWGRIKTSDDAFACRSKPADGERVLALGIGGADSLLNDSVFAPATDTMLSMSAGGLKISTLSPKSYKFEMSGEIEKSSRAKFVFDLRKNYFKNSYVPYYKPLDRKNCPKTPTGWMSWNTYFDKATAEDNLAEARVGKKFLQPFGCEIWSIESWQGNSDKLPVSKFYHLDLEVNEKQFPDGMKKLADDIRALGFRPGIWISPYGTGNRDFYEKHKDWFLHDANGKPIWSWNGLYTIDPTVPEALAHIEGIMRKASREWGYEFFKIDGMSGRDAGYCAHLYERPSIRARFKNPKCANPFELTVQAFRRGIGGDRLFLACQGHTSGPEAAYAEMARTGADIVHPNKPVMWKNVLLQGRCTVNQIFTHNISMIADPDTVLVRDLPLEEARTTATIVALPGQLTFFGDKLANLAPDRMKILQQTLPAAIVRPAAIYPYFDMLPVWNLAVKHPVLGEYNVVAFFNWGDEEKLVEATAKELGIPEGSYTCREFWTGETYTNFNPPYAIRVPAHGVRVLVARPTVDRPRILATDRHIAQTNFEILDEKWDAKTKTLKGKIALVDGFPTTVAIHVPTRFVFKSAKAAGAKMSAKPDNNSVELSLLKSPDNKEGFAEFELKF